MSVISSDSARWPCVPEIFGGGAKRWLERFRNIYKSENQAQAMQSAALIPFPFNWNPNQHLIQLDYMSRRVFAVIVLRVVSSSLPAYFAISTIFFLSQAAYLDHKTRVERTAMISLGINCLHKSTHTSVIPNSLSLTILSILHGHRLLWIACWPISFYASTNQTYFLAGMTKQTCWDGLNLWMLSQTLKGYPY